MFPTITYDRTSVQNVSSGGAMRARLPLLFLLAAAALLVLPGVALGGGSASRGPVVVYVVESGDTLWGIARQLDPDGDPRPIVDQLTRGNDLRRGLESGQPLQIPAALAECAALDMDHLRTAGATPPARGHRRAAPHPVG